MAPPTSVALALRVALAQTGNAAALDSLLRDHQRSLYRHAMTILRDEDLALDVLQVSLLLIARKLGSLRDPRWFRAWSYRITTRECLRAARRQGREQLFLDQDLCVEAVETAAPEPASTDELRQICTRGIDQLPAASQLVVRLHYLEDLTLAEIAEALELPLGTVKSRLAYGLTRLRNLLSHNGALE